MDAGAGVILKYKGIEIVLALHVKRLLLHTFYIKEEERFTKMHTLLQQIENFLKKYRFYGN